MDPTSFPLQAQGDTIPVRDLVPLGLETAVRGLCYLLHITRFQLRGLVPMQKEKKEKEGES